jgi:transcriptional regulator with XRE-family HTH domain
VAVRLGTPDSEGSDRIAGPQMDEWGVQRRVNLAAEVKRWRDRRGLSYRALAKLVACEHSHLWKIEHGRAVLTRDMAELCDQALNAGGALVAAWVAAQGSVRPAQLPIAPGFVVGRDAELAILDASLRDRARGTPAVVAIDGPAGVGKTVLALRWAHHIADHFVDGQLYADLRGFAPPGELVTVDVVLERFLTAMGASSVPATTAERAALYRSLVAERKVLVILDNVNDTEHLEHVLPASARCAVVVTSRRALPGLVAHAGATRVTLAPLADPEAIALISRIIGEARAHAEEVAVATVAQLCGNLPLALRIAAEQIATYPKRPIAELVEELREEDHRLGALDSIDLRGVLSWSYHDLEPDAARLFRLMGLHRGPHLSVPAIAALAGTTRPDARRLLHRLASVHLVDIDSDDAIRLHDLIRAYARELVLTDENDTHRTAAAQRLVTWYVGTMRAASLHFGLRNVGTTELPSSTETEPLVFADDSAAGAWCNAEQANLEPITALAITQGPPGAAHQLAADFQHMRLFDITNDSGGSPLSPLLQGNSGSTQRSQYAHRGADDEPGPADIVPTAV